MDAVYPRILETFARCFTGQEIIWNVRGLAQRGDGAFEVSRVPQDNGAGTQRGDDTQDVGPIGAAPEPDQVDRLLQTMRADLARECGLADARLLPDLSQNVLARLRAGYGAVRDPRRLRAELGQALAAAARLEERGTRNGPKGH